MGLWEDSMKCLILNSFCYWQLIVDVYPVMKLSNHQRGVFLRILSDWMKISCHLLQGRSS
ncbi:unnamed protein product, partial [Vitis vinifera]|uniref:Uncharacterized protein n=1 Tax=Vitis vinifera TaxID=29760 RepID=D7TB56_VITVI